MVVGVELTSTGWIPSYAVLTGVSTTEEATKYGSFYYIVVIICRFVSPNLSWTNTKKLKILLYSGFVSSLICLWFQKNQDYGSAALFGAILYGFGNSGLYPLILVVSTEYGIALKPEQTANMVVATVFSSGLLTGLTGILMHSNIELLFYSLMIMSAILLVIMLMIFKLL